MNPLLPYFIKSGSILLLLWLYYRLFLQRQTSFQLNRFYLLCGLLLAVAVPLLSFKIKQLPVREPELFSTMRFVLKEMYVWEEAEQHAAFPLNGWTTIYIAGVALFSCRLLWATVQLQRLKRQSYTRRFRNMTFVILPSSSTAFSFFNTLFVGHSFRPEDRHSIFEHEKIHIRQKHSLDLLLAELICILNWFNPIVWLLKQSIAENHEYIVDRKVTRRHQAGGYLELLVRHMLKGSFAYMNYFSSSNLKKRMIMMTKKQTGTARRAFTLLPVSVLLLALCYGFTCTSFEKGLSLYGEKTEKNENVMELPSYASVRQDTTIFTVVETMPQFREGNMATWVSQHVKYPVEAIEKHISGKVFVGFIIEKNGTVSSAQIVRGVHPVLDAEALRVVGLMPPWTPGRQKGQAVRVRYVLPVNFAIPKAETKPAGTK